MENMKLRVLFICIVVVLLALAAGLVGRRGRDGEIVPSDPELVARGRAKPIAKATGVNRLKDSASAGGEETRRPKPVLDLGDDEDDEESKRTPAEKKLAADIAQGVLDVTEEMLPEAGKAVTVEVPLHRPKFAKTVGHVKLELRA